MKRKSKKKSKYYVAQTGLDLRNRPKYVTEDEVNAPPEPIDPYPLPNTAESTVSQGLRRGIIEPQRNTEQFLPDPSINQAYNQQQQRPGFFEKNEFNPYVKGFNTLALGVTAVASKINNLKTDKDERQQYLDAINPPAWENMERYGLNTNPVFTKFGGKTAKYQVGGTTAPAAPTDKELRAMRPEEIDYFNNFLGYVEKAGYKGSTKLNTGTLNEELYKQYQTENPSINLPLRDLTRMAQYEQNRQKDFDVNFAQRKNIGNADALAKASISPIDDFFGSETSKRPIPRATLVQKQNDQVVRSTDLGYVPQSINNATRNAARSRIPAGVKVEKLYDAQGNLTGEGYEDPQTGNIVQLQYGGSSVKKVDGLPDAGKKFANVEAEKGEVVEGLNGTIAQVDPNGKTHEQGGEFIPNVQRVLENTSDLRKDKDSKYLKLEPKQILALTGMNTRQSMSHAKALVKADEQYEKQRTKIVDKIELASRDNDELNKYAENSTKLNLDHFKSIPTKDVLFENLFNHQELVKKNLDIKDDGTAKKGGYVYKNGGLSREEDRGSDKKPYPSVKSSDFAGGDRSYPIPTKADAIDALRLAGLHGRDDVRAKVYAKYPALKKQAGGLVPYKGNKSGKKTPAGNPDAYVGDLNKNLEELKGMGFNYEGITDPRDFQTALYNKKIEDKKFDDIREMWKEGMHEQGMSQARNLGYVDDKGNFLPGVLDKEENLRKLGELYPDGILGRRTMTLARGKKTPPRIWEDQDTPDVLTEVPENKPVDTSITNNVQLLDQPKSKFNEPLRWFDVASPIGTYMSALERLPEKYNPAEFNQLRYKLLDPTVALQQNQADFNASVQAVQGSGSNSGAAMANIANLASKKYAMNNQVLGNYENQNAQIKNQEILYNTQVRDKQSVADQQAREVFENKVLTGKAKQQEQKLTALDSLYKTIAENRALNRNGNLIMKFSRAFDQYGDYNGYQTRFQVNPTLGVNPAGGTQATSGKVDAAGGIQNLAPGKSYYNRKSGKVLRFDGVNLTEVR